jgi:hypothetical protein
MNSKALSAFLFVLIAGVLPGVPEMVMAYLVVEDRVNYSMGKDQHMNGQFLRTLNVCLSPDNVWISIR